MPAHRSSCFVVVREVSSGAGFKFDAIVGVYGSINRAEEMCGVSAQALRDAGSPDGYYIFLVRPSNYYDE